MNEALQTSPQAENRYPEVPPFAEPHPAVERSYLLSDDLFNVGLVKVDADYFGFGREALHGAEWGKPDKGPLRALRIGRENNDRLVIRDTQTFWEPPDPDDYRHIGQGLPEDLRVIWTPQGFVAGATDVRKRTNIATGVTSYIPSGAKWQFPSIDALVKGAFTRSTFHRAEIDHSGQTMRIDGKNFTPNKFPLDPQGRTSTVKFLHRMEGEENSHTWLLLSETPRGLRIDQRIAIPTVDWNEEKSGTGGPLIWIDQYNAISINHGFTRKVRDGKYYYSIGWGWFKVDPTTGECSMPYIDPRPLITPHMLGGGDELHSERKVSYTCGGAETRDLKYRELEKLEILVNQGDRRTLVVEVNPREMVQRVRARQRMEQRYLAIGSLSLNGPRTPLLN